MKKTVQPTLGVITTMVTTTKDCCQNILSVVVTTLFIVATVYHFLCGHDHVTFWPIKLSSLGLFWPIFQCVFKGIFGMLR